MSCISLADFFTNCRGLAAEVDRAEQFLRELHGWLGRQPSDPAAYLSEEDDGVVLCWRNEKHHFEIEFSKSGGGFWFYQDRKAALSMSEEGAGMLSNGGTLSDLVKKSGTEMFFRGNKR